MTGSTIATTVSAGITVGSATYPSPLTITATGTVAPSAASATGVYAAAGASIVTVINQGLVSGGGGGYSGGGVGGDGVDFLAIASLTNTGTISGGAAGPYGEPSAYGGVGVDLAAGGGVTNEGTIFGGTGGEYGGGPKGKAGHGGAGGDGVDMAGGTLTNTAAIYGGNGGTGGSSLAGGFGGSGAYGVDLAGGSLTNSGTITGGAGGLNGGDDAGAGLVVRTGAAATNNAAILGGQGGNGGYNLYGDAGFFAGNGGTGAIIKGGVLTDNGIITGGNGGTFGQVGNGAPGVMVEGGTLIAAGTIAGGYNGGSSARVEAVYFQGTASGTLVLDPGAVFDGTVAGNAADVLALGSATTAQTLTGLGTEFTGFGLINVASGADWTLPGGFTAGIGDPGVVVAAAAMLAVSGGTIAGGGGGYGGAGGAAITLAANDSLANHGAIAGGTGGSGGTSLSVGNGGLGVGIAANDGVANYGTITGGTGGNDYTSANGGAGGDAVDLAGGTLTNIGVITGGAGGREASNGLSGVAAGNAPGGFGVDLSAGASVKNDGTVTGGGQAAGAYLHGATLSNYQDLAGGYRGDGASLTSGATLTNDATINGGSALGNGIVNGAVPAPVGNGVALAAGSTLTNNGTITAGLGGAGALLGDSSMINTLVLTGGEYGDGASLASGASMTNHGTITGGGGSGSVGAGVALAAATTLTNDGTVIGGQFADGVYLASGASLANLGMITGGMALNTEFPSGLETYGVHLTTGAQVTNIGTIAGGSSGTGAYLGGGTLRNAGTIKSGEYSPGVSLNGGTLINAGTIAGKAASTVTVPPHTGPGGSYPGGSYPVPAFPAVKCGSIASVLVVDPGALFIGPVTANTSASDALVLGAGTAAGTLSGLGSSITGFNTIAFDPGAAWMVQGSVAAFGDGQSIIGFGTGDTIDLQEEKFGASPTLEPSADTLTISGGGNSVTLNIAGAGADLFSATTNAATTGTDLSVQCFLEGTRIRTGRGDIAVEALAVGDLVPTEFSGMMPVRWLGHRRIDCRRHPMPVNAWPVRVLAGAFGAGKPQRDVFLSPDHAVFIRDDGEGAAPGVLIPIRYLVNGRTVAQEPRDAVAYWHVELDRHEVLLAEGLACESYLDTGNRGAFANGGATVQMHADFALRVWETDACARLLVAGAELEAVRSRLLAHAETLGHARTDDPGIHLIADEIIIRPEVIGRTHRFRLPRGAKWVRLVSRSAVPAQMRNNSTDHRRLGVAVSKVVCNGKPIPLTDPCLGSGWHAAENGAAWRWTDGDGGLPAAGGQVLDIDVAITGRYWLSEAAALNCAGKSG